MKIRELKFITDVLQKQEKIYDVDKIDWYVVLGFVELHKVSVPFLHCLDEIGLVIPQQIYRKLKNNLYAQIERQENMQWWAKRIEDALNDEKIEHAFLKGSILATALMGQAIKAKYLYDVGERISNDIDLLVHPKDLTKVNNILREYGFSQGFWNFRTDDVELLSRKEIINRRMNRGETAPYMYKTQGAQMFCEIDVNFSMDYLPSGNEKMLENMLSNVKEYDNGLSSLDTEDFFIHLLMHQHKEMIVLSMVKRNKDIELYKYLDIYRFIISDVLNWEKYYQKVNDYNIRNQCDIVLGAMANLFDTVKERFPLKSYYIIDPQKNNDKYMFSVSNKKRVCCYDSSLVLKGIENEN